MSTRVHAVGAFQEERVFQDKEEEDRSFRHSKPHPDRPPPRSDRPSYRRGVLFYSCRCSNSSTSGLDEECRDLGTRGVVEQGSHPELACRPPKEFNGGVPLSAGDNAVLSEMRESSLKLASLVESFKKLSVQYEKASSSNSTLAALADKAKKEKEGLSSKVQELETKVSDLTSSLEVSKAEVDQASKKAKEKEDEAKERDAELKSKDDKISELEKKVADLLVVLRKAVSESFDNAVSQAQILNPGLVTEGMDFTNTVKDGEIIQCIPEVHEGDNEEE